MNNIIVFLKIPEYIPGYPLFNMTECVMYFIKFIKRKRIS